MITKIFKFNFAQRFKIEEETDRLVENYPRCEPENAELILTIKSLYTPEKTFYHNGKLQTIVKISDDITSSSIERSIYIQDCSLPTIDHIKTEIKNSKNNFGS